ncbi:putative histidine-binding protein [Collinsella sp. AK_207A]|uniref:ABC transporter substrate-binding protein n=1 Tax=Collinsella sp. AK_207A TaxID=2650472 RepID=UPI001260A075|nr:ABC transporter substrate-binding protein [Collinsella sp. AK_207A]VWM00497.1 putative histidine-binding protein [Collinsella sp. AK_207A]
MLNQSVSRRQFLGLASGFAAIAGLGLVGCGGSSTSGTSSAGSSAGSAASSSKDGYTLVKDGTLTVGTAAEYEPFEYMEDGQYKGFDLDLIQDIAKKLGLTVEFANVDFDTIVPGVSSGAKYDVGIGAITVTPERKKEVDFTDSYYMDDQAIVTMKDNADITGDNYKEKLDSADAKIAVQSGSTAEAFAKENFPNAELVPFKNATDCFSALQAGQSVALVTNRSVAAQLVATSFDNEQVVKLISTGEEYAIAVNKDNSGLKDAINKALKELTDDGTVDSLMGQYNIK